MPLAWTISIGVLLTLPTLRTGHGATPGTCQAEVSGDLTFKVKVTDEGGEPDPVAHKPSVKAATDYWVSDKEMRRMLAAMNGAFGSVGAVLDKKGLKASEGEIRNAAVAGGRAHQADEGRDPAIEAAMKSDPRFMLLLMTCSNQTIFVALNPSDKSKYANVPFRAGQFKIVPTRSARPGEFTTMVSLKDGEKWSSFRVTEPGTLELTQFDDHALKGTFSFDAKSDTKKVTVKGSFSVPCQGKDICKP